MEYMLENQMLTAHIPKFKICPFFNVLTALYSKKGCSHVLNGNFGELFTQKKNNAIFGILKKACESETCAFMQKCWFESPDTYSLDVICSATIQVQKATNTVAVGPMCGLNNYRKTSELA